MAATYFSDLIILRRRPLAYDGDGFAIPSTEPPEEKQVWANRHSVTRSEFFAAQSASMRADIGFTVRMCEYDGQSEVEHEGKTYTVVRTFELDSENTDLTCARR